MWIGIHMKTIQMTIDEPLVNEVDRVIGELHTSRSAFIREALQSALRRHNDREMEKRHAEGYRKNPVEPGEFDLWEGDPSWGDR